MTDPLSPEAIQSAFQRELTTLPASLRQSVARYWEEYLDAAQRMALTSALPRESAMLAALVQVWACSDFVAQSCCRHPQMLEDLLTSGDLNRAYAEGEYERTLRSSVGSTFDDPSLGIALRQFRRREMVRIAWRDLAGWATLDETLAELSALARASIEVALERLYEWHSRDFGTPIGSQSGEPQQMVVLGMGKLGAAELNFSSDIDLIFAYPEDGETQGGRSRTNQEFFIRLGQRLINALNQQTGEGFVFRVDMRLRPFGDAGPLVASFSAIEAYYQTHGREWERYALIKADVVAGERQAGARLLDALRPFIYRRYLDYGAFESLREMKALISQQVARKGMKDNIKLGAGGIREVEFIGQAFQLIRGGREPALQVRGIRQVLRYLGEHDYLPAYVAEALDGAYLFLRRAENRIQALADQQSHDLPVDELDRQRIALAMGYEQWELFEADLRRHMAVVHSHFEQVFSAPQREQAAEQGSVFDAVWQGSDEAQATLQAQGFDDPAAAEAVLTGLRESRRYQNLMPQARERLDRLMPLLLGAVAAVENSSQTLQRVVGLLEAVVRRSAYLALLVENPMALSQLVKLCAASPWIAAHLARHPLLLDELLDPRTLYAPLDKVALAATLERMLARVEGDEEQTLEVLRQFKQAQVLRVAAADVSGVYPLMQVSDHLTEIAEVLVERSVTIACDHLSARHGYPRCREGGGDCRPGFIVVAYGKMGGIELGYSSDLDLVFLHGNEGEGESTAGERPIDNAVFFTRLGQRIIHTMTAHTPAGVLYEIDSRLRPSGAAGMLVSSIAAFEQYQQRDAWTWEHQALVRARVVAGDAGLGRQFEAIRREVLSRPRDPDQLRREVVEMRHKMREQLNRAQAGAFDLKQGCGGIADIEFMVQYSILRWAHDHPALLRWSDNIRQLETLKGEGLMAAEDADLLAGAYRGYRAAAHRLALQEAKAVVPDTEFSAMRAGVVRIWRDLMESVQ